MPSKIHLPRAMFYLIPLLAAVALACTCSFSRVLPIGGPAASVTAAVEELQTQVAGGLETLQPELPDDFFDDLPIEPGTDPNFEFESPSDPPLQSWRGIPIMPQARAGSEVEDVAYSYLADVSLLEVEAFYEAELKAQGWQEFSNTTSGNTLVMLYSQGIDFVTITAFEAEALDSAGGGMFILIARPQP